MKNCLTICDLASRLESFMTNCGLGESEEVKTLSKIKNSMWDLQNDENAREDEDYFTRKFVELFPNALSKSYVKLHDRIIELERENGDLKEDLERIKKCGP